MNNITQLLQKHELLKLRTGSELLEDERDGTLYIRNIKDKQVLKVCFENGELTAREVPNSEELSRLTYLRTERLGGD